MNVVLNVALAVIGAALILVVFNSALRASCCPGGSAPPSPWLIFTSLRRAFDLLAREGRAYGPGPGGGPVRAGWSLRSRVLLDGPRHRRVHAREPGRARGHELVRRLPAVRVVVLHPRPGAHAGRPAHRRRRVRRGRHRPRPPRAAHRVPPHHLRGVLAPGAVGCQARHPGRAPPSGVELLTRYNAIGWNDQLPELGGWEDGSRTSPRPTHPSACSCSSGPRTRTGPGSPPPGRSSTRRRSPSRRCRSPGHPRPGSASEPGRSRSARSPPSSGSPSTPTPDPTIRSASPARSSTRPTSSSAGPGSRSGPTASGPGATCGLAGQLRLGAAQPGRLTMAPYAPWSSDRSLRYRVHVINRRRPAER